MRSLYSIRAFKAGFALAQLLPRGISRHIADGVAHISLRRSPAVEKIMRENFTIATGFTGERLDALVRENFRCYARMLADYFLCVGSDTGRTNALMESTEGWEHLATARAAGRGTIIVTGHLGHWELGGILLALRGLNMTVITLPEPTDALTCWRMACRHRLGIGTIAVGPGHDFAFVEMLRTLRGNGCLAMLVDRPYEGTGIPVRQFGRETQYSTAAAMLAHHTGAAVIPAFVLRLPNHRYRAITCPPVPMATGSLRETLNENTQRIADVFAVLIRQHPDQWFNHVPLFKNP